MSQLTANVGKNGFFNKNEAKQNRAFASVAAKIRRADFSVRTERGEVLRQTIKRNILLLAAKRGENHSGACWVFPLKRNRKVLCAVEIRLIA